MSFYLWFHNRTESERLYPCLLYTSWDKSLRELTRYSVIVENAIDKASERDVPDILCSALTDDCIGRGKTIKEGGAVYDFISGLQVGIANMADSLAAVKKLVYDEKKITRDEPVSYTHLVIPGFQCLHASGLQVQIQELLRSLIQIFPLLCASAITQIQIEKPVTLQQFSMILRKHRIFTKLQGFLHLAAEKSIACRLK